MRWDFPGGYVSPAIVALEGKGGANAVAARSGASFALGLSIAHLGVSAVVLATIRSGHP